MTNATTATHMTSDGSLLWVNSQGLVTGIQPTDGLYQDLVMEMDELPRVEDFDLIPF